MRKLLLLVIALTACQPLGYYVANVYSVNGALVMSKCEISGFNKAPNPTACHEETIVPAPPPAAAYPPQYQPPQYQPPVQSYAPSPSTSPSPVYAPY